MIIAVYEHFAFIGAVCGIVRYGTVPVSVNAEAHELMHWLDSGGPTIAEGLSTESARAPRADGSSDLPICLAATPTY